MICFILGCVVASLFYKKSDTKGKIRTALLAKIEKELNHKSISERKNSIYKFVKDGDMLIVYPRDLELLEEQLTDKLIQNARSTNPKSSGRKEDTLSLENDKFGVRKDNDGSLNINLHAMDDISSIYDIGDLDDNLDGTNHYSKNSIKSIRTNNSKLAPNTNLGSSKSKKIARPVHPDVKKVALLDLYKV